MTCVLSTAPRRSDRVSGSLPEYVLLGQNRADEPDQGGAPVGEDAHDIGPAADLVRDVVFHVEWHVLLTLFGTAGGIHQRFDMQ